jgi:hypothetical protein
VDDSPHDAVGLQLAKLLREHLLGDRRNRTLEVREAQDLAAQQLPAAFDEFEGLLYALRSGDLRVLSALTFTGSPRGAPGG